MESDILKSIKNDYVRFTGTHLSSIYMEFLISIVLVEGWEKVLRRIEGENFTEEETGILCDIIYGKVTPELWHSTILSMLRKITKVPEIKISKWEEFDRLFAMESASNQKFEYKMMMYLATYSCDRDKGRIGYMLKNYELSTKTETAFLEYNRENDEHPNYDILTSLFNILYCTMNITS